MPAQIGLPILQRTLLCQLIERLEKLRLPEDHLRQVLQAHAPEVNRQRRLRIIPDHVGHGELMVIGNRIAQLHA